MQLSCTAVIPMIIMTSALFGCHAGAPPTDEVALGPTRADAMVSLEHSLNPLREHVDAHADQHQFLAILSPT